MKILATGDIHGDVSLAKKLAKRAKDEEVDLVLIMSVNPGFGGQKFIPEVLSKISNLRAQSSKLDIVVDGGINEETAKLAIEAGVNVLVAGSYIFGAKDRKEAIERLRG